MLALLAVLGFYLLRRSDNWAFWLPLEVTLLFVSLFFGIPSILSSLNAGGGVSSVLDVVCLGGTFSLFAVVVLLQLRTIVDGLRLGRDGVVSPVRDKKVVDLGGDSSAYVAYTYGDGLRGRAPYTDGAVSATHVVYLPHRPRTHRLIPAGSRDSFISDLPGHGSDAQPTGSERGW